MLTRGLPAHNYLRHALGRTHLYSEYQPWSFQGTSPPTVSSKSRGGCECYGNS